MSAQPAGPGGQQRHHHHHHHHHGHHHHHHHYGNLHEDDFDGADKVNVPLPPFYRATLYADEPDVHGNATIDPVCGLVLTSFGEKNWNGRCRASEEEQNAWFAYFNSDDDEKLTLDEVLDHMKKFEEKMRQVMPASLHGLLIDVLVEKAFEKFDLDRDGLMNNEEWNRFLDELERRYLTYRRQLSFQSERAFYGRGLSAHYEELQDEDEPESGDDGEKGTEASSSASSSADTAVMEVDLLLRIAKRAPAEDPPRMQWGADKDGVIPPGWWEDFYYYSANHHPVHGIVSCDPDHLLSSLERVWMEMATLGFLFIAADLKAKLRREDDGGNLDESDLTRHALNALISLAGIAVYYVLYVLFTCPVLGFVDKSRAKEEEVKRAKKFERLGEVMGYLLMSLLAAALLIDIPMIEKRWEPVLLSRLQGYVLTWAFFIFFPFNPFFAWGNNSTEDAKFDAFHPGDYLGIGQWRIEKQRFQGQCRKFKDMLREDLSKVPGKDVEKASVFSKLQETAVRIQDTLTKTTITPGSKEESGKAPAAAELEQTRMVERDSCLPSSRTARSMESKRGVRQIRLEHASGGSWKEVPRRPSVGRPKPRRSARGPLTVSMWGEVFGNADVAWKDYMAGRRFRDMKPDSAQV